VSLESELFLRDGAVYRISHIALYSLKLNMKSECSDGTVYIITLEINQIKLCVIHRYDCSTGGILCCILFNFMILYCS
jgi:hypothetical protein